MATYRGGRVRTTFPMRLSTNEDVANSMYYLRTQYMRQVPHMLMFFMNPVGRC